MKSNMTWVLAVTLAYLTAATVSNAQTNDNRPVTWVHGFAGNAGLWQVYQNIFDEERRMNGRRNTHPDDMGVAAFAADIGTRIEQNFPGTSGPSTTNLAVGHSMGGVALRELARTNTGAGKRLAGLVTVGSPNRGVAAIHSVRGGQVTAAAAHACGQLTAGPNAQFPFIQIIVEGVPTTPAMCSGWANILLDGVLTDMATGPSQDDVVPGSPFLTTLNAAPPPGVEVISVWGDENSPVHWRMLSSFESDGGDDTRFVHIANQMRGWYMHFYQYNLSMAVMTGVLGFLKPTLWAKTLITGHRAIQWHSGVRWFDRSEKIWMGLIRCTGTPQTVTLTHSTFVDCSFGGSVLTGTQPWINCIMDQCNGVVTQGTPGCIIENVAFTTTIIVNNKSDGFICDQTQMAPHLPPDNIIRAGGVNHMEMRNTTNGTGENGTDEMSRVFNLIWDSTNPVFNVPLRQ